ncbi:MAG: alpha/beta fold hydrolase [Mycoplasma sp.]
MFKKEFLNFQRRENPTATILFFHGILSNAYFAPPLEQIAKEMNYDFLSYTFPHHKENKTSFKSKDFFNGGLELLISKIINQIKTDQIIIIGHSAGANWATRCYRLLDEKRVKHLILLCPICSIAKIFTWNKIKLINSYFKNGQKEIMKTSLKNYYLCEQIINNYNFKERNEWIKFFFKLKSKKYTRESETIIRDSKSKTSIISGEIDMVIDNKHCKQLYKKINPNLEFIELKGATHIPQIDNPEIFTEFMKDFLAKHK